MAKQVQLRRGSTAEHSSFTGAVGETTVDTDKDVVVVHDGSTAGGHPAAKASLVVHLAGAETVSGNKTFTGLNKIQAMKEKWNIVADNLASGDNNFDVLTAAVWKWTTAGDANATLNFRGDGSNTLNSLMSIGDSITVAAVLVHTGTAYYVSGWKIDGSSVTPKLADGTAISAGSVNAEDVYTATILKTADATFTLYVQKQKMDEA